MFQTFMSCDGNKSAIKFCVKLLLDLCDEIASPCALEEKAYFSLDS